MVGLGDFFGFFRGAGRTGRLQGLDPEASAAGARYTVFDTELTGLDEKSDNVISIGAVRITEGRIPAGDTLYMLVDPEAGVFRRDGVVIHGITPSDVAGRPVIDEAVYELYRFIGSDIMVGHCLSIDLGFLDRELKRIIGRGLDSPAADTYRIHQWLIAKDPEYRELVGKTKNGGLYEMAEKMGITVRDAHNAQMDAYITAQVFQRQLHLLAAKGVTTLGRLLRIADPHEGGDISSGIGDIRF